MIDVDLWSDTLADPGALVKHAVRRTLADLQSPASSLLGSNYVEHLLQRLQSAGYTRLPSPDIAVKEPLKKSPLHAFMS